MSGKPWSFEQYRLTGLEGQAPVPGGVLSFRLAGPATAAPVVVFESGWTASYPYAVWLEEALTQNVRVLCYDRAGVGDSIGTAPLTTQSLTDQLSALLTHLGIRQPVVVAGHSYGGLIAALHTAQAPSIVRAMVQIDPTPELDHQLIDPSLNKLPTMGRFLKLCALLGLDGPLFMDLHRQLPPEIFARIKRDRRWLMRSLDGAIAEARLLGEIRRTVTASASAQQCARLVISCDPGKPTNGWLRKLLMNDTKARRYWDAIHGLHQRQAALGAGQWMTLPYNHVSLVTDRACAQKVAISILDFIQ